MTGCLITPIVLTIVLIWVQAILLSFSIGFLGFIFKVFSTKSWFLYFILVLNEAIWIFKSSFNVDFAPVRYSGFWIEKKIFTIFRSQFNRHCQFEITALQPLVEGYHMASAVKPNDQKWLTNPSMGIWECSILVASSSLEYRSHLGFRWLSFTKF